MFLEALDNSTRSATIDRLLASGETSSLDTATTTIPTIETSYRHRANLHQNGNSINDINDINHHTTTLQALPCFNDLIAVLIECFSLIAIGYLSGRFRVISPDAKDLGAYLTTFALPMIIFLNVAQMEIQTINLSFLVCMLISKLVIFLLVSLVTLAISYPSNFSYAGALSILSTQSNDFALGYPLFKSLYGESKPEMLNYLNLMGPIQLLIINPLGIIMLEFGKSQMKRRMRRRCETSATGPANLKRPARCAHCQAAAAGAASPTSKQMARVSPGDREQSTSRSFAGGDNAREMIARKNCKSLVLVMPGRLVSDYSLSDDSVGSSISCNQQVASGKTISPNLLGDLSPENSPVPAQGHSSHRHGSPSSRNWLAAIGGLIRNDAPSTAETRVSQPASPLSVTSQCTCWQAEAPPTTSAEPDEPIVDLGFLWALMTNPLIIVSLVALAVNLLYGPELPKFVTKVSNTIAASFAAPALLVVGLSMYGKFKLILRNPNDLLLSSVLVMTKVMVLPNIMRTVMQVTLPYYVEAKEIPHLVDFSYLYGLLPTAPGACIIAKQYEVLTNVVSISMLLSTFISAPLMLGTSVVISKAASITPDSIVHIMGRVLKVSSSLTITMTLLTFYLLWRMNKNSVRAYGGALLDTAVFKSRHLFTILLTLTQLLIGIGGFLWLFVDVSKAKHSRSTFHRTQLNQDDDSLSGGGGTNWHTGPIVVDDDDEGGELLLGPDERLHFLGQAHGLHSTTGGSFQSLSSMACTLSFIQASGGILLAKFLILCIVVTNFARHAHGHQMASQVSSLVNRVFPLLVMGVVMCLVFESKHLTCQPTEASLPRWPFSLYLRLIFNALLFCLALSLFVATLRLKNKSAQFRVDDLMEAASQSVGIVDTSTDTLTKRQFVASNVSISSGTSSELTTSTNIETNQTQVGSKIPVMARQAPFASTNQQAADVANLLIIDYGRFYQPRNEARSSRDETGTGEISLQNHGEKVRQLAVRNLCDINNNNSGGNNNDDDDAGELMKVAALTGQASAAVANFQADDSLNLTERRSARRQQSTGAGRRAQPESSWPTGGVDFDRSSILVVFMLFQTMLSVTSILQILFQDSRTTGTTFIMVELTNLVVDLGQGLVTFLVVGTQTFSRGVVSSAFGSARTHQQLDLHVQA